MSQRYKCERICVGYRRWEWKGTCARVSSARTFAESCAVALRLTGVSDLTWDLRPRLSLCCRSAALRLGCGGKARIRILAGDHGQLEGMLPPFVVTVGTGRLPAEVGWPPTLNRGLCPPDRARKTHLKPPSLREGRVKVGHNAWPGETPGAT